jgi:hypothetical protein
VTATTVRLGGKRRDRTYTKVFMSVTAARRAKSAYVYPRQERYDEGQEGRQLGAKNDETHLNWQAMEWGETYTF